METACRSGVDGHGVVCRSGGDGEGSDRFVAGVRAGEVRLVVVAGCVTGGRGVVSRGGVDRGGM